MDQMPETDFPEPTFASQINIFNQRPFFIW